MKLQRKKKQNFWVFEKNLSFFLPETGIYKKFTFFVQFAHCL